MRRKQRLSFLNAGSRAPAASEPALPPAAGPGRLRGDAGRHPTPSAAAPQPSPAAPGHWRNARAARISPPGRGCRAPGGGTDRQADPTDARAVR